MGIFGGGGGNKPEKYFGVRVNQSQLGYPLPTVMGTAKIQQSILWEDGFSSQKQSSGGGKGGGGVSSYTYTADVIAGLCNGTVSGIGDIWTGQSWLGQPHAAETCTISGSSPTYTVTNAFTFANDLGVSVATTYSGSYNDFCAPSATVLSGTDQARMVRVSSNPSSGQYTYTPSTGTYDFSTTDSGKTVTVNYSYNLTVENQQENDIIPSGKSISVGGNLKFSSDLGVVYASGSNQGVALTKVTGTPSATGTYSVSGSAPATYKFASGDVGVEVTITYQVTDPNAVATGESSNLNFTLNTGAAGQLPYSFLTSSFPGAALGYTGIATVLYQPMWLGSSAEIQENTFEVVTADAMGGGIQDCNPVQCITQVLTNSVWGLGVGAVPFPTSVLDNGTSGTWGSATSTGGTRANNSTAYNWFAANNFFISPVMDSQDSAASTMSKWLEAGMCAAFMSEGLLKLAPYGDTTTAANGYTWVAPSSYVVALDDTCFVAKEGTDPVKVTRSAWQDAYNVVQVQWDNRSNQYAPEVTQESDQGLINRFGERREDPQNWDFIHTLTAATFAANMRLKHGAYIRNTYEFTLPYTYSYLEPMDIATISTTSVWAQGLNNANLGITNLPVRITKVVDDPTAGLQITAEDYAYGAHLPVLYNKQLSSGDTQANMYADPGSAEVVMFEATSRLTGYTGNEIWIGACGTGANYGSCNIWVSSDGNTYEEVGTITQPARLGQLTAALPSGSDPDTSDTMLVQLAENCPALTAGSQTDANNGNTLCYVDGEIIAYSSCSCTAQNTYTMGTYLRRGQMGSTIKSHSSGGLFLRLDQSIFKYTYDPNWYGKTLYFKFQPVNAFGLSATPLSNLTATQFTVPGLNPGTVSASSGLVLATATKYSSGATVDSLMPAQAGADVTAQNTTVTVSNPSFSNGTWGWNIPSGWNVVSGGVD
jgi:hypothetical protein